MLLKWTRNILLSVALMGSGTLAWSSGFYVGVGAGPKAADFNKDSTTTQPGHLNVHDNAHRSGTGLFGSLFGGYAWIHQSFYLGGEANIDGSTLKYQSFNNEMIHKNFSSIYYRMPYSFDLTLVPGYLLCDSTLFYARIGYALGLLKISSSDDAVTRKNKNLSGICFGIGLNQKLSQQTAVRVEYRQVNYQNTSTQVLDVASHTTNNANVSPTTGQVEFAFVYNLS